MDKISGNSSSNNNRTKTIATVAGVLSASVLAYCGYKIVDNKLKNLSTS